MTNMQKEKIEKKRINFIQDGGNLYAVSEEGMAQEPCDAYLQKSDDFKELPEKFLIMKKLEVKKALLQAFSEGKPKSFIACQCQVPFSIIDEVINDIKEESPELYQELVFCFNNDDRDIEKCARIMGEIIDLLGPLDDKLTDEQKIKFVTLIHKEKLDDKLNEIYAFAAKRPIKKSLLKVVSFLNDSGFRRKKIKGVSQFDQTSFKARYGTKWLKKYDIEAEYAASENGIVPTYKYISDSETLISIDKEIAAKILLVLETYEIPSFNCIVRAAFKSYANGNFNKFVCEFQTNYLKDTNKDEFSKTKVLS